MGITDNSYNLGTIIPIGSSDLKADDGDDKRSVAPGQISYMRDAFGLRVFQYLRCRQSGGHAKGELASKQAIASNNVNGTVTPGTNKISVSNSMTAGAYKGWLLCITNNSATVGAAPEGEVAIVASNTASMIYLDNGRPFSTAPANGDGFNLVPVFDVEDAANGDRAANGAGICFNGISEGNWGWYHQKGIFPNAKISANGTTRGQAIVASAAVIGSGALPTQWSTADLAWGHALVTLAGDLSTGTAPVFLNVFDTPYSGE